MKTPLQELIERLEMRMVDEADNVGKWQGYKRAKAIATELLEKEKEQIKEAYKFSLESPSIELSEEWAEQYYNETYNQNK